MSEPFTPGSGDTPPETPRWVKLLGLALLVAIALLVLALLVFGGDHGPGRHS